MKVLVISNYSDYHSTRPEAEIFKGLSKLGFDIHIMTYGNSEMVSEFRELGIKIINFHPEKKFDKKEIQFIREYLIKENIQILHLFNSPSTVNGIIAAKKLPVKVVLYRGYAGNISPWNPLHYTKYLHPRVDKIFCNSMGVEAYLRKKLIFGKDKAITINKGHQTSWYSQYTPLDIKKELGIDEMAFLLINVANNRSMKGIPYLLKAMNLLPETANIHLLLVGNGMDSMKNMKIINSGKFKDKIHILGFRKDVLNIVAATDVFVLSSIKGESITKSVIEAMSLGIAPIITDIPGNVELVNHNESGLVVPFKNAKAISDAIVQLYSDRKLCDQLKKGAKNHIERYLNSERTIIETKKMYENLLKDA